MREMFVRVLFVGCLLASPLRAQEAAKPAQAPPPAAAAQAAVPRGELHPPKIAVLDIDKVWNESLLGKSYTAQLEKQRSELQSLGTKKETELKKMTDEIQALQEDLNKQQGVLSPPVIEQKTRDITKKKRDAEDFITDGKQEVQRLQQELQMHQQQLQNEFLTKIQPYVELVAKERGVDLLLEKRATYYIPAKDLDISQEVVVKADDGERARGTKGAAAPASPGAVAPKPAAQTGPVPKPTGPQASPSPH
jgi:Skp family chaperone for outer membrane proteins